MKTVEVIVVKVITQPSKVFLFFVVFSVFVTFYSTI